MTTLASTESNSVLRGAFGRNGRAVHCAAGPENRRASNPGAPGDPPYSATGLSLCNLVIRATTYSVLQGALQAERESGAPCGGSSESAGLESRRAGRPALQCTGIERGFTLCNLSTLAPTTGAELHAKRGVMCGTGKRCARIVFVQPATWRTWRTAKHQAGIYFRQPYRACTEHGVGLRVTIVMRAIEGFATAPTQPSFRLSLARRSDLITRP